MSWTWKLVLLAVVAYGWLPGCDGDDGASDAAVEGGLDAGVDGGLDARPEDGARDSPPADERERPRDAGAPDEGSPPIDAGTLPAGWTPMPGLPDGCVVERAQRPEVLFEPEWESCGDGCELLTSDPRFQRAFASDVSYHDGTGGYLGIVQREWADPLARRMMVFARTDGLVLGAWRGPSPLDVLLCQVGAPAIGSTAAAFVTRVGGEWPRSEHVYHAPLSEIGEVTEPVAVLDETVLTGTNALQNLAVSSTTVAAELQPKGVVWVYEDGMTRELGGRGTAATGNPQQVQVVGRQVFWIDWSTRKRIAHGGIDRSAAIYFEVPGADVLQPSITADRLVWQQGYDYGGAGAGWARGELWAAPFPDHPSQIEPRMVVDEYLANSASTAGPSVYASLIQIDLARGTDVYDLADGRRRRILRPDGWQVLQEPLYVTDSEMLLLVGRDGVGTVMRIQLESIPYVE